MSVPSTDWMRVKAIFDAAVVLEPDARPACLRGMCGSDDELRQHVEALLASHERAGSSSITRATGPGTNAAAAWSSRR